MVAHAASTHLEQQLVLRALELARDSAVSVGDTAAHLARLARGQTLLLEIALAQLGRRPASPACEQARVALELAVVELRAGR
jgi:hypothetical protein